MRCCWLSLTIAVCALIAACDSDPADVAGDYTIAVTNGDNGCDFTNWVEGETSTGIELVITQEGKAITGSVSGATGLFLDLWLGAHVYTGQIDGNELVMTVYGTASQTEGNCTYTINSTVIADSSGDVLVGEILYTAATNDNPDCADIEGCVSRQAFNGTRPPQ